MKTAILAFALALGLHAQLIDDPNALPQNVAGVGTAIGPTRADMAGWGVYARLLSRSTGTYSLTGVTIVPALASAGNGHSQIVLTPTAYSGVSQIIVQHGRVIAAVDAGIGASLPTGMPSFSFSGTYAGGALIRTKGSGHIAAGLRISQTPLGFVPTLYLGHAWSW